jgi:hypothetical protein
MKKTIAALLFIHLSANAGEVTRTWTDVHGRTLKGVFLSASDTQVTLERDDGKVFVLETATLSESDRHHVAQALAATAKRAKLEASKVLLRGQFVGRVKEGILVYCEGPQANVRMKPRADRLASIGGQIGANAGAPPKSDTGPDIPQPRGTFLVVDYPGTALNDYDEVTITAYPIGIRTHYTLLDGAEVVEATQAFSTQPPTE